MNYGNLHVLNLLRTLQTKAMVMAFQVAFLFEYANCLIAVG
jgi:hypothetical protein